jgi:hypothetical protein
MDVAADALQRPLRFRFRARLMPETFAAAARFTSYPSFSPLPLSWTPT